MSKTLSKTMSITLPSDVEKVSKTVSKTPGARFSTSLSTPNRHSFRHAILPDLRGFSALFPRVFDIGRMLLLLG